jgi:uncharacterized protein YecE (DUF72 family)
LIRVGTAGWSYPDWDGRVYPAIKPPGFHPLTWLAQRFDCVEINSTFYGGISPRHSENWAHRVACNPGFRFLVKLSRAFTHEGIRASDERQLDEQAHAFLTGLEPLRHSRRLAAVLVQFPVSFLHGEREVHWLGRIRAWFAGIPLALEVRHASWFTPPAMNTIRGLSYSLVQIDLPHAWNHPRVPYPFVGPIAYFRLLGRNSDAWFRRNAGRDERYDYMYSTAELGELAGRVAQASHSHEETFVIANNHLIEDPEQLF